jgi:hypothetical protein
MFVNQWKINTGQAEMVGVDEMNRKYILPAKTKKKARFCKITASEIALRRIAAHADHAALAFARSRVNKPFSLKPPEFSVFNFTKARARPNTTAPSWPFLRNQGL